MRVEVINNQHYQNNLVSKRNSDVNVLQLKNIDLNSNSIANLNKMNINFCAMKKNQFTGIDRIMVERLTETKEFNVQKIKVAGDFQNFCNEVLNTDIVENVENIVKSIDIQAQEQKRAILSNWIDYIVKENDGYNNAMKLFILSSITKNLSEKTNHLPPILDKRKVADTMQEITEQLKINKGLEPNFDKIYRKNLTQAVLETEKNLDTNLNGWIIIPSKSNDSEHFEENVKKLQTLSHDNWCTKTYNAKPYLADGDFHIYMENGKPKLGVRFNGEEIQEIQGEHNNTKITITYLDIAKSYVEGNKYRTNEKIDEEFKTVEKTKQEIAEIKQKIGENAFKNKEYDKILSYLGCEAEKDENGMLILSHYKWLNKNYTFSDLGIDENDMFKHIKAIKGDAVFKFSGLTSLGKLQSIGGNAYFSDSKITSLGELQSIGGYADFSGSHITSLGKLKSIGGDVDFWDSQIISLGNLQSIGGDADFSYSRIRSLGELKSIGGDAYFNNYTLKSDTKLLQTTTDYKEFDGIRIVNLKAIELESGEIININQELNKAA